jgi:predicted DNA-binding transcriptional regulator AlpA
MMNLLKPEDVSAKLGITKAALPALRRREDSFPQPIRVSQKILRWDEADIDQWLNAKKERDHGENSRVGGRPAN